MNFFRILWIFLGGWFAYDAFSAFNNGFIVLGLINTVIALAMLSDLWFNNRYRRARTGITAFGFAALGAFVLTTNVIAGLVNLALSAILLWQATRKPPDPPACKK